MPYTFLLGGARSGKSSLAVRLAAALELPAVVIATAEARDEEMAERIRTHRRSRPAEWETIEAPLGLLEATNGIREDACVILDCLTLWVSNAFEAGASDAEIDAEAHGVASVLARRAAPGIVVSNEVGLGIVPANELARTYRDVLGRVNASFAEQAARSFFVVAGRGLPLEEVTQT
ncbi:MAG TPA: bifunctional adenosylcobinamide kinase/adenosylcobinamide-phosphate guanylyltransferase [Actinomycetota bacterium]|jgi:adenosyl cobinamide kinase/adenosyl cobinamide phosphate guanylyltransferase|nr:bifunctional adenosylcobinamide kinase/adenosylcobinamide-phosphate guanylyltransferase [Actinomycetota bacterium]